MASKKIEKLILNCFDPLDLKRDFSSHKSGVSVSFEAFRSFNRLVLAHHTSSTLIPSIKINGILPHFDEGRAIQDGLSAHPNCVYLSSVLDRVYFSRAVKKYGGNGIVVLVEVNRIRLEPDENALSEIQKENLPVDRHLYHSLSAVLGACRHKGTILPDRFRRIYDENGDLLT